MINTIIYTLLILLGIAFISLGIILIMQWKQRIDNKNLTRGTFEHLHCWLGGVLGIADIVVGLTAIVMGILTAIFGLI